MKRRNYLTLLAAAIICGSPPPLAASHPEVHPVSDSEANGDQGRDDELSLSTAHEDTVTAAQAKRRVLRITSGVSLAVAVAANFAGQSYARHADQQYDRYLTAGNPTDMDRYFNRSTSLDRNAGYSFVLFQTSLLAAIVTFFLSLAQP